MNRSVPLSRSLIHVGFFSVVSTKDGIPNPYSLRKDRKDHTNIWQITLATLSLSHTSRMIKHKHQPIISSIFHHLKKFLLTFKRVWLHFVYTGAYIPPPNHNSTALPWRTVADPSDEAWGSNQFGNLSFTHFPSRMKIAQILKL